MTHDVFPLQRFPINDIESTAWHLVVNTEAPGHLKVSGSGKSECINFYQFTKSVNFAFSMQLSKHFDS